MSATDFLADNRSKLWTRNRYGYKAPHPETGEMQQWRRASSVSGMVKETWAIQRWEHRRVIQGMATHPELTLRVLADFDDDDVLDAVKEDAKRYGGGDAAAEMGTALHRIIEQANDGDKLDHLTPDLVRRIDEYRAALAAAGLVPVESERIVCLPDLGIMGQFDMILSRLADAYVADLKTGADVEIAATEFAIQVGIYTRAKYMVNAAGDAWEPMPPVDQDIGYIVHLPSQGEGCTLYEVDVAAGFEAVERLCEPVREWRRRSGLLREVKPAETSPLPRRDDSRPASPDPEVDGSAAPQAPAEGDRAGWITLRLGRIAEHGTEAMNSVAVRWPEGMTVKPPWTSDQIDAIDKVLDEVEAKYEVAFGPSDPTSVAAPPATEEPAWEHAPTWDIVDSGEAATDEDAQALGDVAKRLNSTQQARLRGYARDARNYSRPFDASPMTKRQWSCARAAISIVRQDHTDDYVVKMIRRFITNDAWDEHWTIGGVLGALSIEQAETLADESDAPF